MTSNCNECGRKTPKKVYLCNPCINFDPDFSDYRTEEEIQYEEQYWEDVEEMMEEDALKEFWRKKDEELEEKFWELIFDQRNKEAAIHALTGN